MCIWKANLTIKNETERKLTLIHSKQLKPQEKMSEVSEVNEMKRTEQKLTLIPSAYDEVWCLIAYIQVYEFAWLSEGIICIWRRRPFFKMVAKRKFQRIKYY
jgi:hypothetical protein